ncbi:universal stress protein [Litoreibacter arenae]|uniref:Universal stress protein family n=1 Tax=Litoreibacter arenae DSM 19593 TaxID=1123360 RepID=S9QFB0_9RHOB|nr:universal stress protein [Litoreibacter arenae]EPX78572.1 Universal stress protein family [Litoreibacter arenae DSM 19593]
MKNMITHILCATDLSKHSAYTMCHAASLAAATGAKLHLVHAVIPMSDETKTALRMYMQASGSGEAADKARHDYAKTVMAERQKEFWDHVAEEDKDIRKQVASIELVDGYPAEVILRRAAELKCDLIVIGAHEHGFTQTFLGTVAKRVLRRSTIPTLVVPYQDTNKNT